MEPRRPRFPLQQKVMLLVSATLLLCLSGAGIFALQGRRDLLEEQLQLRARGIMAALSSATREALLTERLDSLNLLIRKVYVEDKDVLSIRIEDRRGVVVASSPDSRPSSPGSLDLREEVILQGFRMGAVDLVLRREGMRASVDRATFFLLLALLDIILMVGFVVHMSIKGFVSRPLDQLLEATEQIARGDFTRRSLFTSNDELGVLARAFDEMAEGLERYRGQAQQTQEELERRVELRTAELREAQAHTAAILENLPVSVLVVDQERRLEATNPAARTLADLPDRDLSEPPGRPGPKAPRRTCGAVLDTPLCRSRCLLTEAREGRPNLEETRLGCGGRLVLLECSPLGDGGLVTVRDLTRIQAMRAQIRRSDRLSSLGTLAAGLAHELNNPLGNVSTYSQLLQESSPDSPRWGRLVTTVRDEAERAATIVGRLLAFAHPTREEVGEVELRELAEGVSVLLGPVLEKSGVELRMPPVESAPERLRILADGSQLQQVLVNLVLNASQATGEGGWVQLEVLPGSGENPGDWPGFRIRDNGPGIAAEHEEQLFDPFFTTKEVGEGTGLGLSVCYGILRDHGGQLTLRNHPEGGAEALVRLPPEGTRDEKE